MRDSLRRKIHHLIRAINEALAESGGVSDSLQGVRDEGFDLMLILEATVILNRDGEMIPLGTDDWEEDEELQEILAEEEERVEEEETALPPEIPTDLSTDVSEADREFLRTLRIRYTV